MVAESSIGGRATTLAAAATRSVAAAPHLRIFAGASVGRRPPHRKERPPSLCTVLSWRPSSLESLVRRMPKLIHMWISFVWIWGPSQEGAGEHLIFKKKKKHLGLGKPGYKKKTVEKGDNVTLGGGGGSPPIPFFSPNLPGPQITWKCTMYTDKLTTKCHICLHTCK